MFRNIIFTKYGRLSDRVYDSPLVYWACVTAVTTNHGLPTHHVLGSCKNIHCTTDTLRIAYMHSVSGEVKPQCGRSQTQYRIDMKLLCCTWDNHSMVKITMSFLLCMHQDIYRCGPQWYSIIHTVHVNYYSVDPDFTYTFVVSILVVWNILEESSCPGKSSRVYFTSSFCSQRWLWIGTSISCARSPRSLSSGSEQVIANLGVTTGWMRGFCMCDRNTDKHSL